MKLPETKGRTLPDKIEEMPGTLGITERWLPCKQRDEEVPLLKGQSSSRSTPCSDKITE